MENRFVFLNDEDKARVSQSAYRYEESWDVGYLHCVRGWTERIPQGHRDLVSTSPGAVVHRSAPGKSAITLYALPRWRHARHAGRGQVHPGSERIVGKQGVEDLRRSKVVEVIQECLGGAVQVFFRPATVQHLA